ncbi:hypothetical protein AJ78_07810 [Emergomyces pasteurianus Ep9510]|uniref:Uncharacterized protein n=1 Tax=Emergomyces pasteurianus Ep9510 TaxID=1447872 RepID=A0A1J9Q581_9EURO|nr:hypothetical protein AJ78_07810 [Emergomyces pasteurianus Ep9510]
MPFGLVFAATNLGLRHIPTYLLRFTLDSATPYRELPNKGAHGYVFRLPSDDGIFVPYELHEDKNSTRTELLVGPQEGTLIMSEKDLIGFDPPRIATGWSFKLGERRDHFLQQ